MIAGVESPQDGQAATLAARTSTMVFEFIDAPIIAGSRLRCASIEQLPAEGELRLTVSVGEESVVPDPHEARGELVEKEAPEELDAI